MLSQEVWGGHLDLSWLGCRRSCGQKGLGWTPWECSCKSTSSGGEDPDLAMALPLVHVNLCESCTVITWNDHPRPMPQTKVR